LPARSGEPGSRPARGAARCRPARSGRARSGDAGCRGGAGAGCAPRLASPTGPRWILRPRAPSAICRPTVDPLSQPRDGRSRSTRSEGRPGWPAASALRFARGLEIDGQQDRPLDSQLVHLPAQGGQGVGGAKAAGGETAQREVALHRPHVFGREVLVGVDLEVERAVGGQVVPSRPESRSISTPRPGP